MRHVRFHIYQIKTEFISFVQAEGDLIISRGDNLNQVNLESVLDSAEKDINVRIAMA